MKTFLTIVIIILLIAGIGWWVERNRGAEPAVSPKTEQAEFCYARIEKSPDSEFEDKHTLRLKIDDGKATGELRFMPAEKDALVGTFEGTVTSPGAASARAATLWWDTTGEGMTARQELSIHFDSDSAEVGMGAMKDRGDGTYVYEDPAAVDYSFQLPGIPCETLSEREAVEKHLWNNIATLSPIAPVLGGNWYVVAATIDPENNTGTVVYEDGHIQERRTFFYTFENGEVTGLSID